MSRCIDADSLIEGIANKFYDEASTAEAFDMVNKVCDYITDAPSIELVRCAECKFSESVITSWSTDGKNNVVERLCKVHKWSVKDDDYCSCGEREGE